MQCTVVAKGLASGLGMGWLTEDKTKQGEWTEAQKYPRRKTNLNIQTSTETGLKEHLMLGPGESLVWGVKDLCSDLWGCFRAWHYPPCLLPETHAGAQ